MRRLSISLPLHSDESVASHCSRLAAAHDFPTAPPFTWHLGISFEKLCNGSDPEIERYSNLTGLEGDDLKRAAIRVTGDKACIAGEWTSKQFLAPTSHRFCPACLVAEEALPPGRKGSRAYFRLHWCVSSIRSCETHDCALSDVAVPQRRHPGDFSANNRDLVLGPKMNIVPSPASPLDRYVLARLHKRPTAAKWLDAMPLDVACRLTETVGAIVRHGIWFDPKEFDEVEWSKCAVEGFAVSAQGPEGFSHFIRGLTRVFYRSAIHIGPRALFGRLFELVKDTSQQAPYTPIRQLIQTVAIEELPIGPGQEFLGIVRERKLHSITSASFGLGLGRVDLRNALRAAEVITPQTENLPDHQVVFPVDALDRVRPSARCSMKEAMRHLNTTSSELNALLRANLLFAVPGKRFGSKQFLNSNVERALNWLQALPVIGLDDGLMTSPTVAAFVSDRSPATVMKLVFRGQVHAATTGEMGFAGLVLDAIGCARLCSDGRLAELSFAKARAALQVSALTLEALVREGFIAGNVRSGRDTERTIPLDSLIRFAGTYVSGYQLASVLRSTRPHMAAQIATSGIPPAIPMSVVHTNFYQRSQITL
ncbi:TniQ family protein [Ensifer sp. ENS06]|uniref:TniQ family protein n=1 Tax=Ensifer sp. ENS06 TaxID=2769276 RepID=UPI001781F0CE|nr:TniQ family protein [Ensifer sp. ENS06]MBD9624027.1 TniQ family protein [Ensifer sp. ENS06]